MTEITLLATPPAVSLSSRIARWLRRPSPKHPPGDCHRRDRREKYDPAPDKQRRFAGLPAAKSALIIIPQPSQSMPETPKSP
jgi:hypothetical protein